MNKKIKKPACGPVDAWTSCSSTLRYPQRFDSLLSLAVRLSIPEQVKTKKSASHGCLDGNLPSAEIGGKSNRLARGRDSEPRNTGETHQFL
jgi:hypothetical protein